MIERGNRKRAGAGHFNYAEEEASAFTLYFSLSRDSCPKVVVRYPTSDFIVDLSGGMLDFLSTIYINPLKLESSFRRQISVFSELKSASEINLECYLGAFNFYSYFLGNR